MQIVEAALKEASDKGEMEAAIATSKNVGCPADLLVLVL